MTLKQLNLVKVSKLLKLDTDVKIIQQNPSETEILVNLCLDSGSDLDCIQRDFLSSVELPRLKDQKLSVVTVHGSVKQTYLRYKVCLVRTDSRCENIAALQVNKIGSETQVRLEFLTSIQQHFCFDQRILDMLGTAKGKIHLLLGSNHAKLFSRPVPCKDLGPFHRIPWLDGISSLLKSPPVCGWAGVFVCGHFSTEVF